MKTRLGIFAAALLLLPPLALLLSAQDWPQSNIVSGTLVLPALLSSLALIAVSYLLDTLSFRRSGTSLLRTQLNYILWLSYTGAMLGAIIACLNSSSSLWNSPLDIFGEVLLAILLGSVLLPAILITRLWLSGASLLLRYLTRTVCLPALAAEPVASLLLLASLTGLLGGTAWPMYLGWLFWLSPLLLLISLQLIWHESTVFSALKHGDWSRVILGAASGILVCGGIFFLLRLTGGTLYLNASTAVFILLSAAFGLLCLQLGDVIAENWRGKKRSEVFKRKPFPIPVATKKG
jgi:hypothetical protein